MGALVAFRSLHFAASAQANGNPLEDCDSASKTM